VRKLFLITSSNEDVVLSNDQTKKVAIMGGGISGLTSAYELAKQGVAVELYEAGNRLGGHIHTKRDVTEGGLSYEYGAELVNSSSHALLSLTKELGVEFVSANKRLANKHSTYIVNGVSYTEEQALEAYKPLAELFVRYRSKLRDEHGNLSDFAKEIDRFSVDALLSRCEEELGDGYPLFIGTIIRKLFTADSGRELKEVSALAFLETVGTDTSSEFELYNECDEAFRVKGGTDTIIHRLEEKLTAMGVTIHKNTAVTHIEQTSDGMRLYLTKDGEDHIQDYAHIVSALPLSALRHVDGVDALELPPEQLKAIQETNYATPTKMGVVISGEAINAIKDSGKNGWIITDGIMQNAWISTAGQEHSSQADGMVIFYIGGEAGKENIKELSEACKREYAQAFGLDPNRIYPSSNAVEQQVFTNFEKDEKRGCYNAPAPNQVVPLMSFKHQSHSSFSMVGEFIPCATKQQGHNFGYMNNAVDGAAREMERVVGLLQQREQGASYNDVPSILQDNDRVVIGPATQQFAARTMQQTQSVAVR
jgi:monoamine oxidase